MYLVYSRYGLFHNLLADNVETVASFIAAQDSEENSNLKAIVFSKVSELSVHGESKSFSYDWGDVYFSDAAVVEFMEVNRLPEEADFYPDSK